MEGTSQEARDGQSWKYSWTETGNSAVEYMSNFLSNIRITERVNGEVNPRVDIRVMKVMRSHAGSAHTMILLLSTAQDLFLRLYLTVEPLSTSASISARSYSKNADQRPVRSGSRATQMWYLSGRLQYRVSNVG